MALTIMSGLSDISSQGNAKWFPTEKMSYAKAATVVKQIKDALVLKRLSFKSFFELLDVNNNKLLSFEEFTSDRFDRVVTLSPKVKEELFALMDKNSIGMVDYESFLEVLQITAVTKEKERVSDSFSWEEGIVKKLR